MACDLMGELRAIGIEPTAGQVGQCNQFYELVVEKNKVMNLTAITEYEAFVKKHLIDSLTLVKETDLRQVRRLIDIGTGAGFPGIPLKIFFPEMEIVLLDSLNKRVVFLQDAIKILGLKKITAIHGRAEEPAHQKEYRESFDLCVSRAVANLATLSEYCLPYVKVGGEFIAYKSGKIEEEWGEAEYAVQLLGGEAAKVERFVLPGTDMERTLLHIRKKKPTPKHYPRSAGIPAKEPLKRKKNGQGGSNVYRRKIYQWNR